MIEKEIGLGLSGGGYRAAAYHIGTLEALDSIIIEGKVKKANNPTLLSQINNFASASGGSITNAYYHYGLKENRDFREISSNLKKKLLFWNCEFFSIILNPILFIVPLLTGIAGLLLIFSNNALWICMEHLRFTFITLLSVLGCTIIFSIILEISRKLNVFRYQIFSVVCVIISPFLFVSMLTVFKHDGILLSWLMLGFGLSSVLIAIIIIVFGDMVNNPIKLLLILVLIMLIFILCSPFISHSIKEKKFIIDAVMYILTEENNTPQIAFGLVFGFFAYIVFFFVHLLLPTGFSAGKGTFFRMCMFGKTQINQLPDDKRIGILATRMETGRSCIFQKTRKIVNTESEDKTDLPGNSHLLSDAVSKSCNWPPVFEPEELLIKGSCKKNDSNDGDIILLNAGLDDYTSLPGENDRIESYNIIPSDKTYRMTGKDGLAITLSDGGILDNHGVSILTNRELKLFSKVILLSDSDPPFEYTNAHQGFFGHVVELISKVLVDNVHSLNYEKYFNAYFRKFGSINVKPLFISLSGDIETCIDNYRKRARIYQDNYRENKQPEIEDYIAQSRFLEYNLADLPEGEAGYESLLDTIGFTPVNDDNGKYGYFRKSEKMPPGNKNKRVTIEDLRKIQTRLIPMGRDKQENLIRHARTMTEFLVKFWILEPIKKSAGKTMTFAFRNDIFIGQINKNEFKKLDHSKYDRCYKQVKSMQQVFYVLDYMKINEHAGKTFRDKKSFIREIKKTIDGIYRELHDRKGR